MIMRIFPVTVLFLSLAASPAAAKDAEALPAEASAASQPLLLDGDAIKAAGIVLDTARLRTVADVLEAPGEVAADAYSTVLISPRVAAQVVARKAKSGDVVAVGEPLVVLSSVEVAQTQGDLIVASQDWQRVASLGTQAVSARRYNEALVRRDQAKAKLRAYGLSDRQISNLIKRGSAAADGSFELLAPRAGRITTDRFLVGERIEPGRTLFTLVAEASVWVEARLSPAAAEQVKAGDAVTIVAHGTELPGKVMQRSHQTDEKTRTVDVRIQVANEKDLLHPGELVESRIAISSNTRQLAVPAEAVVLLQNQPTVFVQGKQAGRFAPCPVEVGETREGWTEIKQGLAAGTTYARKGAFALKARVLRAQLGED